MTATLDTIEKPRPWERGELAKAYDLGGTLGAVVDAADNDPDAASVMFLGEDLDRARAAVVVLKSNEALRLFHQWATRNRMLHGHSPGMVAALKRKRRKKAGRR